MAQQQPAPERTQDGAAIQKFTQDLIPHLRTALPKHMQPDRLLRAFYTSILRAPKLLLCGRTPEGLDSIKMSLLEVAGMGLYPDSVSGMAYILPFKSGKLWKKYGEDTFEAKLIPGYRGLIKLGRNTGEIVRISVFPVYEGDRFRFTRGLVEVCEYEESGEERTPYMPAREEWIKGGQGKRQVPESGTRPKCLVCVIELKDGGHQMEKMTFAQVEAVRARSKSGDDGPWITDWLAMGLKTVIKRTLKLCPSDSEPLNRAIALDDSAERGEASPTEVIDLGTLTTEEPEHDTPQPPSKLKTKVAAALPAEGAQPLEPFSQDIPGRENLFPPAEMVPVGPERIAAPPANAPFKRKQAATAPNPAPGPTAPPDPRLQVGDPSPAPTEKKVRQPTTPSAAPGKNNVIMPARDYSAQAAGAPPEAERIAALKGIHAVVFAEVFPQGDCAEEWQTLVEGGSCAKVEVRIRDLQAATDSK